MTKRGWISKAVKRPGEFTRKAEAHGMSTQAYARKVANDPHASTRTKRQAALARTFKRMGRKSRHTKRNNR